MNQFKLSRGPLLNKKGHLAEKGYSKHLSRVYNKNMVKGSRLKLKEWDYFLIYNEDFALAITVADNAYLGLGSISFMDFKKPEYQTTSKMMMLPLGKLKMPTSSHFGDIKYKHKDTLIEIEHGSKGRILKFEMKNFKKNNSISGEILLSEYPKDTMAITVPFHKRKRQFYYNHKIIGMKATGFFKFDGKVYDFSHYDSYGIIDWGRGVWPYKNQWYWSSATGLSEGHLIGFNLGHGFGNTSFATENMIFYDNRGHKLNDVDFKVPKNQKGKLDYTLPWTFTSSDDRFNAVFTPLIDRMDKMNLGFLASEQHQVFGHFTGEMVLDNERVIKFENLLGFAEKVVNKW